MEEPSTTFQEMSIGAFQEVLASRAPVPGGGGAAALAGALAASLLTMVGNLTVGKKKYASYEAVLREKMAKMEEAAGRLLSLVDADAKAFAPLSKAYSLPTETKEEKETKDKVLEQCLWDAAAVPLSILEEVTSVARELHDFGEMGSVLARSDVGCAAALAGAAGKSAALNVYVNTRLMKDRAYAKDLDEKCEALEETCRALSDESTQKVEQFLKAPRGEAK
ncbi:MAG: cyclodeaminase/cyclohydrolase family protein [Lachnospiraceae bacterium]